MAIIFIDTETTGLNPATFAVHQIGAYRFEDANTPPTEFYATLAAHPGAEVTKEALAVSGTTAQMLAEYPDAHGVVARFIEFCGPGRHTLAGWGTEGFDKHGLRYLVERYGYRFSEHFRNTTIDAKVLLAANLTLGGVEWPTDFSLKAVAPAFDLGPQPEPHNALSDARLAWCVFELVRMGQLPRFGTA